MKKLTCLFALGFLLFNNTLRANEPEKVTSTEEISETTAKKERIKQVTKDDDYEKFRFGGYGEMVAKFMNYGTNRFYGGVDNSDHRNTIAIPRFVLAFDYKFNSKWILGAEIEFEAGGVGIETELENSENGEYETEMEKRSDRAGPGQAQSGTGCGRAAAQWLPCAGHDHADHHPVRAGDAAPQRRAQSASAGQPCAAQR